MAAPEGNTNARNGKLWRQAIQRALEKRAADNGRHSNAELDELADKLLCACSAGDLSALKELGDRLEGKPAQAIVGDDEFDPLRIVGKVVREIVRTGNPDPNG
jgi:hypothetical protein